MPRGSAPGERRGGRQKGTPNRATAEVRGLFQALIDKNMLQIDRWIQRTAQKRPGDAVRLVIQLAEFCIPKLQRLSIDLTKIPIEEIDAELARREAELNDGADSTNGSGGLMQ